MNQEITKSKMLTESSITNSYKIEMKNILVDQLKNQDVSHSSIFSSTIESDEISSPRSESSEFSLP